MIAPFRAHAISKLVVVVTLLFDDGANALHVLVRRYILLVALVILLARVKNGNEGTIYRNPYIYSKMF